MVIDWVQLTGEALKGLWIGFIDFLPKIIGAVIIFLVGWFIAVVIGRIVSEILRRIKFDRIFERENWKKALEKAEIKVDVSSFVGAIFKWVLVIVFLLASVEILGLVQFASFLQRVLNYLPNVIIAVVVFVAAVIIADILEKVIRAAVESTRIGYGHIVRIIVKWSIWVFAILTILYQLGIGRPFMTDLFRGIIYTLVIAFGLSFGLGGKEVAAEILQDLRRRFKEE
jgi:hypothetical protein